METLEAEKELVTRPADVDVAVAQGDEVEKEKHISISPNEQERPQTTQKHISHVPHDSMVTVRLSEPPPPALHVDTSLPSKEIEDKKERELDTPDIIHEKEEEADEDSPRITTIDVDGNEVLSPSGSESPASQHDLSRRGSDSSEASMEGDGVNWEELQQTEEKEPRNENSDDVSLHQTLYESC